MALAGCAKQAAPPKDEAAVPGSPASLAAGLPPDHPFALCATCHGPNGQGNRDLHAPHLAGGDAVYLAQQVEAFRRGYRGTDPRDVFGQQMRAIVLGSSPETLTAAIAWVAAREPARRVDRIIGDQGRGEMLYRVSCAACHGDEGQGDRIHHMPRLSHQHGWYLADQLRAYRAGRRGIHPDDEPGRTMRFYADLLPDDRAVDDVVAWLVRQSQRRPRPAPADGTRAPEPGRGTR